MNALSKIKQAGFEVLLSGDAFRIAPADKLTMEQREFIRAHKPEIVSELKAAELKAEQVASEIINSLIVRCYSPSGRCYEVEARDEKHAVWLQKMNPQPKEPNHDK